MRPEQISAADCGARAIAVLRDEGFVDFARTAEALDAILDDVQALSSRLIGTDGRLRDGSVLVSHLAEKMVATTIALLPTPTNQPPVCSTLSHAELWEHGRRVARSAAIGIMCMPKRRRFVATLLARCKRGIGFGDEAPLWQAATATSQRQRHRYATLHDVRCACVTCDPF